MPENNTQIEIQQRSEVQEILGNPPGWLLYWGITLVFLVFAVLLTLSWLIKYPDVVEAQAIITTAKPPIAVVAQKSGRVAEIMVTDSAYVEEDQPLMLIHNASNIQDIEQYASWLSELNRLKRFTDYTEVLVPSELDLAQLQSGYALLARSVERMQHLLSQNAVFIKIKALENEISEINKLNRSLMRQTLLLEEDLEVARKNYDRHRQLYKQQLVSKEELEAVHSAYLNKEQQLESFRTNKVNNQLRKGELETQIVELQGNRAVEVSNLDFEIKQLIKESQAQIKQWKEENLITAPIAGRVSYTQVWSEEQSVTAGQELIKILPSESTREEVIARCLMPVSGAGRVKVGNVVNIELMAYPAQEYGVIKTRVESISPTPVSMGAGDQAASFYQLTLPLSDTLMTTYQKVIPFNQEMQGMAKIITEEKRIIERIFNQILDIFKNR